MINVSQVTLLDLVSRDTQLKRVASTKGGEYAGPCPWCGGDDRFHVWPNDDHPHYWCRKCDRKGDAIQYLRDRHGMSYQEACIELKVPLDDNRVGRRKQAPGVVQQLARNDSEAANNPAWQEAARNFSDRSADALWSPKVGGPARDYLAKRGLSEAIMAAHYVGYNPEIYRAQWGNMAVYIPARSLIFPWEERFTHWDGEAWIPAKLLKVKYRRLDRKQFSQATGGIDGLYGWPHFYSGKAVILVEGELCALSIWQACPGLVVPLATGSTSGGRTDWWIARLARPKQLILAFDTDKAGEAASEWWLRVFPEATRLKPTRHDVNDMLTAGDDIAAWLTSALLP